LNTIKATYKEHGVSLVELMVAMAIGLVLMLVVASLFVAQKRTFRTQDDQSRLQETSRAALDVLGYHIRLAGFVDLSDDPARVRILVDPNNQQWLRKTDTSHTQDMLSKFFAADAKYTGIKALKGCDGPFGSITSVALPWNCSAATGPNSITVAYQAQPTALGSTAVRTANTYQDTLGAYSAATGQGGDCGAQDVSGAAAVPKGPLAINRFYIDAATKRLMCVGNGDPTKPRPIAEGVEDMRIRYGIIPATVGTAPMDSFVGRYVKAADVTDWSRVLAVHVCLQIASPSPKIAGSVSYYTDCDNAAKSNADGKIRQTFNATFTLRNNVLTAPDALP
jgi:type IV pilus assembly protein PilW